jgi:hypothetical protein
MLTRSLEAIVVVTGLGVAEQLRIGRPGDTIVVNEETLHAAALCDGKPCADTGI